MRGVWPWLVGVVVLACVGGVVAVSTVRPADPRDNLWYTDSAQMLAKGAGEVSSIEWATPMWRGGGTRVRITISGAGLDRVSRNATRLGLPPDCGPGCPTVIEAVGADVVVTTDFEAERRA